MFLNNKIKEMFSEDVGQSVSEFVREGNLESDLFYAIHDSLSQEAYEIERQSNGHFKVSVINTCAGAPVCLYATLRLFVGRKLRPRAVGSRVLSATNIPLEYLTKIEVLENFVNCESGVGLRERTRSALRRGNAIERDESNSDLQRFGTCALMPLFVWVKLKFDNVFPGENLSRVFQQRFLDYIQTHTFDGPEARAAKFFLLNWEKGKIHAE